MESLIIRFSFVISILYTVISYFRGMYYQDYLKKSIIIFVVSSLSLIILQYLSLKLISKAKISVIEENLQKEYEAIRKLREERRKIEEAEIKERKEKIEKAEQLKIEKQEQKERERKEAKKRIKIREKSKKIRKKDDY